MRTLNCNQAVKGKTQHLCPMQFDIAERSIDRFTKRGETVLDPFAGIGTVPFCAVKMGRRAVGVELSPRYFIDAVEYVKQAEREASVRTLFDLDAVVSEPADDVPEELTAAASERLDAVSPIHVDAPAFGPLFGDAAPMPAPTATHTGT
jgi:16S rRNA G966 N2-methylase RsmD